MRRATFALALAAAVVGRLPGRLAAQGEPTRVAPVPFVVPESPAFRFLGISPSSVDRPTTPQKFAASLSNARDSSGLLKSGVALAIAPAQYLYRVRGLTPTLDEYQDRRFVNWKYWLWNSSLSAGTTAASNDTASTDLGTGLRVVFWDESDAMRNRATTDAIKKAVDDHCSPLAVPGADPKKLAECANTQYQSVLKAWSDTGGGAWNHGGFGAATAVGWRAVGSQTGQLVPLGWSVWSAASKRLGTWGVISGQLQHDRRRALGTASAATERVSTLGGRLIAGTAKANAFLDVAGAHFGRGDAGDARWKKKWSGGVEVKMLDRAWLETGFGNAVQSASTPEHVFYFAGLKLQMFQNAVIRQ